MDLKLASNSPQNLPSKDVAPHLTFINAKTEAEAEELYVEPVICIMVKRRCTYSLFVSMLVADEWRRIEAPWVDEWMRLPEFAGCWQNHTTYITISAHYVPPLQRFRHGYEFRNELKELARIWR